MKKLTYEKIIERIKNVHGDEYDYSLTSHKISTKDNLRVLCKKHGEFNPKYHDHVYHKSKCPKCARENKSIGIEKFINQAKSIHSDKYDYSKVEYVNAYTKIKIICPVHGEFEQVPYSHVNYKTGCRNCDGDKKRKSTKQFIEEANKTHNNKYDYSKTEYTGVKEPLIIICKKHGEFSQTPSNHIHRKSGCPQCALHTKYTLKYFNEYPKNKNIPGTLYLVKFSNENETFIKIGITKHQNFMKRFDQSPETGYKISLINNHNVLLYDAFLLEQKILQKFTKYKCKPKQTFSGQTECFLYSKTTIEKIQKFVEQQSRM